MKRAPLQRKTAMPKRKKPMKKRGKKTLAWETTRRKLKVAFEAAGITRCERCWSSFGLSFAHSLPRRFITTQAELEEVILACATCHQTIDLGSKERQHAMVLDTISKRETPVIL